MDTVAGIRIPDTTLAKHADALLDETSPGFLAGHARRSYVFAALLGRALGIPYDDELLYVCATLHDLGITERFATEERLEVSGARAAAEFARGLGLAPEKVGVVWDAVALHASLGIADAKGGEVALTHFGVALDVVGLRLDALPEGAVGDVLAAYPRTGFKADFHGLLVEHARRNPMAYAFTWFHESVRAHVAPLPTFDEAFFGTPLPD
jgi:hypothetical protein